MLLLLLLLLLLLNSSIYAAHVIGIGGLELGISARRTQLRLMGGMVGCVRW